MLDEHDDLLDDFVEDAREHLQSIEPDLLTLEQSGAATDPEVVNRIFRGVHSIKGAAGFFGLENIGALSHRMENLLSRIRDREVVPTPEMIDALLTGLDSLRGMMNRIAASDQVDIQNELNSLAAFLEEGPPQDKVAVVQHREDAAAESEPARFDISAAEVEELTCRGCRLYMVQLYLNADLREKGKTPFDFITSMESLGRFVDAVLDTRSITGLADCMENDLAFDFLFATSLEPVFITEALDLGWDRVIPMDLEGFSPSGEKVAEVIHTAPDDETPSFPAPSTSNQTEPADSDPDRETISRDPPSNQLSEAHGDEKIRVGVNFLNELVNLAGEMVLGRNQLMQTALPLVKHTPGLNPILQHISRVTSEMQEKIMRMRMQPISLVFERFHRVVRASARKLNKEVRLVTEGGEVDLDKTIIEGLSDPLTHLIRNSVDHGIESPAEREAAGKPRQGAIHLKAFHQGGQVHLEILDDGRGLDGAYIGRKAVEKGIIDPAELQELNEAERLRLIFRPGFSTAESVTDLSGRGVGMDVVRTNIEQLGGTVEIESRPGRGTRILLILPLTLAIVSGLLIRSGDHFFILPEADVDELVRIKPDEVQHRINPVQENWVLRLREMLLPLVDLNRLLIRGNRETTDEETPGRELLNRTEPIRVIAVQSGGARFGLVVDRIISTEEIVVKPLPRYLKKMTCFSGVTILGNGKVALILDTAGIMKTASVTGMDLETADRGAAEASAGDGQALQTLLIFDNGTEERFALPLELISRIERFEAGAVERIQDRFFLRYHHRKLRLVFLEDHLPISRPQRSFQDRIGVIVPRQMQYPIGLVFNQVITTVESAVDLDTESIQAPGLFGSTVLENRITLLPDLYRLFELAAPEWYAVRTAEPASSEGKCRVLLVDDTPFFRMVEGEYLRSAGYGVITARDGESALTVLENEPVDAVILDIVMPGMDGWDTIRAIRADERWRRLPVMAVTSLEERDLVKKGMEAGFDAWELKLDKARLLEKLAGLTAGGRTGKAVRPRGA
ncbi:MAG: chemotaxis protein CheW [Desulfococcaceae bacterium]